MGSSLQSLANRYETATQRIQSTYLWRLFIARYITINQASLSSHSGNPSSDTDRLSLSQARFMQVFGCWLSVSSNPTPINNHGQAVSWVLNSSDFSKTSRQRLQYHLALWVLSSLIGLCGIFLAVIIGLVLFNHRVLVLSVPQLFLISTFVWLLLLLYSLLKCLPDATIEQPWQCTSPITIDQLNQTAVMPLQDQPASLMNVEMVFDR